MKPIIRNKVSLITAALVFTLLVAAFFPARSVFAQNDSTLQVKSAITTLGPKGSIVDTTPLYKWTKVGGADKYNYQVYQGTTKLLEKFYSAFEVCAFSFTTCTSSPAYTLGNKAYKWRVRARISGVWQPWSTYMNFFVSKPDFQSLFNGTWDGWARKGGALWWLNKEMLYTFGLTSTQTSAYNTAGKYGDFDFIAAVKRTGTNTNTALAVRMGTNLEDPGQYWYPGYYFGYSYNGSYYVSYLDETARVTVLVPSTFSSVIKPFDWNTLWVRAKGNNFKFYINNTKVAEITDNHRSNGYVGVIGWRPTTSSMFYVDFARLMVLTTPY